MRVQRVVIVVSVASLLLCWPARAGAQAIVGVLRDPSGAVLPGVSVEAASPALIEKVRTAITNSEGLYRIVDLRPGIYDVTFSLAGFNTVKRQGLELVSGFTATVNVELQVGALEETITVTGASPVVDVQNVRTQTVIGREELDSLPLAKSFAGFNSVIPGMQGGTIGASTRDVGGTTGETPVMPFIHGSDPGLAGLDGLKVMSFSATADRHRLFANTLTVREVVVETGNGSAEAWSGGANIEVVSKDGGNLFNGTAAFDYIGEGWDVDNLNDELRARGAKNANRNKQTYDVGASFGGPIKRDKLWFFVSPRFWGTQSYVAGLYYNLTPHTLFYAADLARPSIFERQHRDYSGRVTWQAASTHKIVFQSNNDYSYNVNGSETGDASPEGGYVIEYDPQRMMTLSWSHPATNRLLVEASGAFRQDFNRSKATEGGLPTDRSVVESSINLRYGAQIGGSIQTNGVHPSEQTHARAALSYIAGSHALKAGLTTLNGFFTLTGDPNYPEEYTFRNQLPTSLTQWAMPNHVESRMRLALGMFAQDQWTMSRLTLNLGLRFDSINAYSPAQTRPAGEYLEAVTFPEMRNIPNWKDLSPRVGAAYDLFGTGRTAVKVSIGRYLQSNNYSLVFTQANSPPGTVVLNTSRTWNDSFFPVGDPRRGNFVPDCNLQSKAANDECGAMANQNFGTSVGATRYADDLKEGWGVNPHIWQTQLALQHELAPRVGLTVGYFRTWWGNQRVTDNLQVTPGDFDPYCVTAPVDSRLPGGGGYQVCGLYNVKREKFGQVDNLVIAAPDNSRIYNGIDVLINARLGRGIVVVGGVNTGSQMIDNCSAPDTPPQFCRTVQPWSAGTEVKFNAVYPLPWWGLQTAATFRNGAGLVQVPTYVATNAEIAPSLGRNLSSCPTDTGSCTATATITLAEPQTMFETRGTQLDARVTKIFTLAPRTRLRANLDMYNLFNAADVLSVQNRYGPNWLQAINILAGRMFKVSAQLDF